MLTHPTLDSLLNLGLHGMAQGFQTSSASPRPPPSRMATGWPSCSSAR